MSFLDTFNDDAMITITPVAIDGNNDAVNKGSPVEVSLADFVAYLSTIFTPT